MPWRIPARVWRHVRADYVRRHAEVDAARLESKQTLHDLADVTMELLETTAQLKETLRTKGETFDDHGG